MASVNRVILIGNCGRDPEVRYMPNGEAVANFSIATTSRWKNKAGERQEETEWHNIVAYRRLGEIVGEYLKKGKPVFIEGRLQTRTWEKDGIKRYSTEIIADNLQLLGSKDDSDQPSGQESYSTNKTSHQESKPSGGSNFDDFDDDIPF
jgi:single-strand DNA-binding protein